MILTLTLNPAIDISYYVDHLLIDNTNRTSNYIKTAGGKGINVSKVLNQLDCKVIASGFLGGLNGEFITKELKKMSIIADFVAIEGETRNCIAIMDKTQNQTEILEQGPEVSAEESNLFLEKLEQIIRSNNIKVVSASGSLPSGVSVDFYKKVIDLTNSMGAKFVLDTSGEYLKEGIKASPFLIKPNIHELEALVGKKIANQEDLALTMSKVQEEYNINFIVVSMGDAGSMAMVNGELYKITIPKVSVKSAVGSGDALVAGLVKGINENRTTEDILRLGNTCGVLNAMSEITGNLKMEFFDEIYKNIIIRKVSES